MVKNSSSQNGSAHAFIVLVLIAVVLGVLIVVFWRNFSASQATNLVIHPDKSTGSKKKNPKSVVLSLENSDMNKYINYENGFQFLFPKQVYTNSDCKLFNTKYDTYGNVVSSEPHYGGLNGPVDVKVLESGDEYTIVPSKTVVQSEAKGTDEAGYIFKGCNVLSTNLELIAESQKDNFGIKNIALEHRSIKVAVAKDKEAVLEFARRIFREPKGTISWTSDTSNDRESIDFIYDPSTQWSGAGAYKLWYYPAQKRIVYIGIGQSPSFQYPDGSDQYYFSQVVDSFKFSTE
jgi:hypothetical protein